MDSNKKDCVKTINLCIENVLENFLEIIELLKVQKTTKLDEMKSLVFSKKRMCELTESIEKIFQNLIQLKLIYKNSNLKYKKSYPAEGFNNFFEEMSEEFKFSAENN